MAEVSRGNAPSDWLPLLAVVVTALVLRPAATAIGPVLDELQSDLGLSAFAAGLLTALPGFCFGLVGLFANKILGRLGLVGALLLGALLIASGSLLRVLTDSWPLFLGLSFIALGGMAIGNVLLPAFIKCVFPQRAALMATVYTTFLALGSILPLLLSGPLTNWGSQLLSAERGWRVSVGIWALVGLASLILWTGVKMRSHLPTVLLKSSARAFRWLDLWRSPTAVGLMVFFGIQSMQAYIQFGWLAQIFRSAGMNADAAGLFVSLVAAGGMAGGILMPRLVPHSPHLRVYVVGFAVLLAAGYTGLALAPLAAPWLWATCLAVSGFAFPTALALIIERTEDPGATAAVSAFVQPVGYFLAALGPLFVGLAFGWIGSWPPILWVLVATSLLMASAGWVATRPTLIDDELKANCPTA